MTEFLQTAYVFLWLILGVLCAFSSKKIGAVGFALAGFFAFMTVWYALRAFWGLPVFEGVWSYVFRGVLLCCLAFTAIVWIKSKKAENGSDIGSSENNKQKPRLRSEIWDSIQPEDEE